MENSNIIISIIIVLCIAAGVTAYGISEGDNAVFSDLSGFSPDSSSSSTDNNGIQNVSTDTQTDGTGSSVSTGSTGTSSGTGGGSSSGGSSSSTGTGTSSGTSSGTGGSGSGNGTAPTQNKISSSEAQSIASQYIEAEGAYVGNVKDDGTQYICYIYNAEGSLVDAIAISYTGENLGEV